MVSTKLFANVSWLEAGGDFVTVNFSVYNSFLAKADVDFTTKSPLASNRRYMMA